MDPLEEDPDDEQLVAHGLMVDEPRAYARRVTAYVYLALAIASELFATSQMKSTEGFTRLVPTLVCLAGYGISFVCLARALDAGMPVGTGYAIWSGLGTALIVTIGVLFLGESISAVKVAGIALVIAGVVVLNLGGAH